MNQGRAHNVYESTTLQDAEEENNRQDCPARGMCYHRSLGLALLAVDHGERAAKERANYERDTAHVPSPQRRGRDALFSDD